MSVVCVKADRNPGRPLQDNEQMFGLDGCPGLFGWCTLDERAGIIGILASLLTGVLLLQWLPGYNP